jgi:hypothetical protein
VAINVFISHNLDTMLVTPFFPPFTSHEVELVFILWTEDTRAQSLSNLLGDTQLTCGRTEFEPRPVEGKVQALF